MRVTRISPDIIIFELQVFKILQSQGMGSTPTTVAVNVLSAADRGC
jgi:hypothetical protein